MVTFLLRHADREPASADTLSPEGIKRAKRLALMLAHSGVSRGFCSDAQRTRETDDRPVIAGRTNDNRAAEQERMLTKLHQRGPAQLRSAEIEIVHQTVLDFDNERRGERARLGELIAQCVGVGESIDLARCRKLCAVICGMGADPAHSATQM